MSATAESDENGFDVSFERLRNYYLAREYHRVVDEAPAIASSHPRISVYNLLALSHKHLGDYTSARQIYERLLNLKPDNTMVLSNLGNLYVEMGLTRMGIDLLEKSISLDPNQCPALLNLASVHTANLDYEQSLRIYHDLLERHADFDEIDTDAIYFALADTYRKKGPLYYDEAINFYSKNPTSMSASLMLECAYKVKSHSEYRDLATAINAVSLCTPLAAAVQNHASIRYGESDNNIFCRDPFSYICRYSLPNQALLSRSESEKIIESAKEISNARQPLITLGTQTAGNIFLSDNPAIQKIKRIIEEKITDYRQLHGASRDGFITRWPKKSILYGWLVELQAGGNLGLHMHKDGWLSGSIYLQIQRASNTNEGNIVFSLNGPEYPSDDQIFAEKEYQVEFGDIIFFPSSLFHRTIANGTAGSRVVLAFDVKPEH